MTSPMSAANPSQTVTEGLLPASLPGHWDRLSGHGIAQDYARLSRKDLCKGDLSDLTVANGVYMASRNDLDLIAWQTAAKERIRWLSAQLAILSQGTKP